jgi:UDPglucose--hexose-1-phosphate uridylyltransferase
MHRKNLVKPDGRKLFLYSRKAIADDIQATNPPHDPIIGGSHLRWHPLRGEWVAYASHRQNRTFLPPKDFSPLAVTKSADFPTEMPAGEYDVAVFENLFPSLSEAAASAPELSVPSMPGKGVCEVVVFTQDPDTSLAELPTEQVAFILQVIGDRTKELSSRGVEYVLPFENRGVEVGVTLHHPHGQLYAYPFVPPIPARMTEMQKSHFENTGRGALEMMIETELKDKSRIVWQEESAIAFIPVCARYPYETWIAPKRKVAYLHELSSKELLEFARTLKAVLMKYDGMWSRPFPYLQLMYQAPTDGKAHPEWHAHIEIFPPYRNKDRLKYLAGTELGAGLFINDCLPEEKAENLRAVEVKLD